MDKDCVIKNVTPIVLKVPKKVRNCVEAIILHGRSATGYSVQPLSVGEPFDAVVYDASQPLLSASPKSHRLSTIVYTADTSSILGTVVNGRWYVINRRHIRQEELCSNFIQALAKIRKKR